MHWGMLSYDQQQSLSMNPMIISRRIGAYSFCLDTKKRRGVHESFVT